MKISKLFLAVCVLAGLSLAGYLLSLMPAKPVEGQLQIEVISSVLPKAEKALPAPGLTGSLLLVNAENPLAEDYVPQSLVSLYTMPGRTYALALNDLLMQSEAAQALTDMLAQAAQEGHTELIVQSAYRDFAAQGQLYATAMPEGESARSAGSPADTQPAGASEHQTGLCVDIQMNGGDLASFGETPAAQWLAESCTKYGFIVRYTEGKESQTGIVAEPWHLRYVGELHARLMEQKKLCLEEYTAYLQKNHALRVTLPGQPPMLLHTVPEKEAPQEAEGDSAPPQTLPDIPDMTISHNNAGGYVLVYPEPKK